MSNIIHATVLLDVLKMVSFLEGLMVYKIWTVSFVVYMRGKFVSLNTNNE